MDGRSVCTPLIAESDAQNNTTSTPNAASATDADKVINIKVDSNQVQGVLSDEALLKGLLADNYCHVCEALLLFESQRLSHYEGKRHAQKLKVYLQAKRAEKMNKQSKGPQRTMTTDKDHFCELCNMVFSSHIVAKSHYDGKVHAKNLRKQGLQPPVIEANKEQRALPSRTRDPHDTNQKSASKGSKEPPLDPTPTTTTPSTEVDLTDPNKYCGLCAATFNNPQVALQHYNGRKHQKKQARQELLKKLGDDDQKANSLMCHVCSIQFNSVEMYQAHMQGSKHQTREKKIVELCKSQQSNYDTFADELADYIQVQKARGITPKAGQVLPVGDTQKEVEEIKEEEEAISKGDVIELSQHVPNLPPPSNPPHHSRSGCYYPAVEWCSPYQGPAWSSQQWDFNFPLSAFPGSDPPPIPQIRPTNERKHKKPLSSSSYSTSSSSSSFNSSDSDSNDNEFRRREKRRIKRAKRERERWARDEDSDKEEKRRKRHRREMDDDSEERRRDNSGESEKEKRGKRGKYSMGRKREKKSREEDFEMEGAEKEMDSLMPEDMMDNRKESEVHIQAEINIEQEEGGQDEAAKHKYRKEKKKTKEKVDTRTEEEKLWDDSILGC